MRIAACLIAAIALIAPAAPAAPPVSGNAPAVLPKVSGPGQLDSVSVTVNLKVDLATLNPLATAASLSCWGLPIGSADANESTRFKQDAHTLLQNLINLTLNYAASPANASTTSTYLADFDTARRDLSAAFSRMGFPSVDVPHYYGSEAAVPLPLANGEYHGTAAVPFRFSGTEFTNPSTHQTFVAPEAFVVCWLYLNGRQAVIGPANQLPTTTNVNQVIAGSSINFMAMSPIPGMQ